MIYRCFKNSGTALNSIQISAKAQLGLIYPLSHGNLQLIRTRTAFCSTEIQLLFVEYSNFNTLSFNKKLIILTL